MYIEDLRGVTHQRVLKNIENLAVCGQISDFCQLIDISFRDKIIVM